MADRLYLGLVMGIGLFKHYSTYGVHNQDRIRKKWGLKVRGTLKRGNRLAGGRAKQVLPWITIYLQGQEIIEHIFGTFKRQWGMDYTLVKGREKVETEYLPAAITYNLTRVVSIFGLERVKK